MNTTMIAIAASFAASNLANAQMTFVAQSRSTTVPSGTVTALDFAPFVNNDTWSAPNNWFAAAGQNSSLTPSTISFSLSTSSDGRGSALSLLSVDFFVAAGATFELTGGRLYQNNGLGSIVGIANYSLTGPDGQSVLNIFAQTPSGSGNPSFNRSGVFSTSGIYRLSLTAQASQGLQTGLASGRGIGNISGVLHVVPSPGAAAVIATGALLAASRRRRS